MRMRISLVVLGLVLTIGSQGTAQQSGTPGLVPPSPALKFSGPWRHDSESGQTRIVGSVVDGRQLPVGDAKVQLRDLGSGAIVQESVTDVAGEYEFAVQAPGTYVVELVLVPGSVAAVSNAGVLARYETLMTLIRLQGRWDTANRTVVETVVPSSFIGMSSSTTMTAATLSMAVAQNIPPVDAGQELSPKSPKP